MSLHRSIPPLVLLLVATVTFSALAEDAPTAAENAAAESLADAPRFRMTYPVRESISGETFTEQAPVTADPSDLAWPDLDEKDFGIAGLPTPPDSPQSGPEGISKAEAEAAQSGPEGISEAEAEAAFEAVGTTTSEIEELDTDGRFESGGIEFRYSFSVLQGYNSNVTYATDNVVESLYTDIGGGVDLVIGGSRLDLIFGFDLGAAYYYNNSELQNDGIFPNGALNLDIDYAVTERLDLSFNSNTILSSQPSFTIVGASDTFFGNYVISDNSFAVSYRWLPKLETITGFDTLIFYYTEPLGTDFSRVDQTFDQQFLYLWKPSTSVVYEYRFNTRTFWEVENYDSVGNFLLLGFNHTLNPRSVLNFRAGAEQRVSQVPVTGGTSTYLGPFGQLELNYSLRPQTVVAFNARYGTTAASQAGYTQDQQFLGGLSLRHAFGRRLNGSLFFNYQNNFYDQPDGVVPDYTTEVYNTGLNLTFAVNQIWSVNVGGSLTGLYSSNENLRGNYNQNVFFIGSVFSF